ncbi:toxin-antitoxin system YwqK family antitoxin [Ancylomarina sp. YFZ004]
MKTKLVLVLLSSLIFTSCNYVMEKFSQKGEVVDQSVVINSDSTDKKSLNGEVRYKFPSGKLKSIVKYKDNKKVGTSHSYYETGEKQYEIPYVDGKKHGVVKWFYKSGKLYRATNYKERLKHGAQKKYWESGKIKSEMLFENDMMCKGLKEFTNTGKQKKEPQIKVEYVNLLNQSNMYHLNLSMEKRYRKVQFYIGKLQDGKCFPLKAYTVLSELETKKGKATFKFSVPKGRTIDKDIPIIAVVQSSYQNYYIMATTARVNIEN